MLYGIINNSISNLGKSSDAAKIAMCQANEITTIVQQFTSDNMLIPIPNDIHTPITENQRTSISVSNIDEGFKN